MTSAWQVPISGQDRQRSKQVAHWFAVSPRTDAQVFAACGRILTPGWAEPGGEAQHCKRCEDALRRKETT